MFVFLVSWDILRTRIIIEFSGNIAVASGEWRVEGGESASRRVSESASLISKP
ncbi:MAG: hypothetical protein ABIG63_15195 [Chloroflexota bacterium]